LQAQQEVPLWLEEYAKSSQSTAGFSNYGGKFGGRDIRKDQPKVINCLNNANYNYVVFCACKFFYKQSYMSVLPNTASHDPLVIFKLCLWQNCTLLVFWWMAAVFMKLSEDSLNNRSSGKTSFTGLK